MDNEKLIEGDGGQTSQANNDTASVMSRRQFSLGVSGIMLTGTLLESTEHNKLSAFATKISPLSTRPEPEKLMYRAFNQPQYALSGVIAGVWSPDSRHIATFQENVVTLYNASTGTPELTYRQHTDEVVAVRWSADSKYLASGGFDHIVCVWDAVSGQTVIMYKGHTDIVRDIVWSPNQRYLASAGYDKTVQVWEALTGRTVVTCFGHTAEIHSLMWSPDGRCIASTDLRNTIMIWRVIDL